MVIGIGIDIIEIERIKESIEKLKDQFLKKIFTEKEIEYCSSKKNQYQHYAARFAAKEAIIKALSSVRTEGVKWKDMEIYNEPTGLPKVRLHNELKQYISDNRDLKITMSHSKNYVTCFAILYNKNGDEVTSV